MAVVMSKLYKKMLLFSFGCSLPAIDYVTVTAGPFHKDTILLVKKKENHHKNKWNQREDQQLILFVNQYGTSNWNLIAKQMPGRDPRQCRERWYNYANPDLNHGTWTTGEDALLLRKVEEFRSKWHIIASFFKNRSVNSCKNRYQQLRKQTHQKQILETQQQPDPGPNDNPTPTLNFSEWDSNLDFSWI
jgi:hypothetical protein